MDMIFAGQTLLIVGSFFSLGCLCKLLRRAADFHWDIYNCKMLVSLGIKRFRFQESYRRWHPFFSFLASLETLI